MTILQTLNQADQNRCIAMLDGNAKSDIELFCRAGDWTEESGIVIWIDITVLPGRRLDRRKRHRDMDRHHCSAGMSGRTTHYRKRYLVVSAARPVCAPSNQIEFDSFSRTHARAI